MTTVHDLMYRLYDVFANRLDLFLVDKHCDAVLAQINL